VKAEIEKFLLWARKFSKRKFIRAFESDNFKTLWNCWVKECASDKKTEILKNSLQVFNREF